MPTHSAQRGRPERDDIEVVRTIAWYYAACEVLESTLPANWNVSGSWRSIDARLEKTLDSRRAKGAQRGRQSVGPKYKNGLNTPSQLLLNTVELRLPGTKRVFEHPVWLLARVVTNPTLDLALLHRLQSVSGGAWLDDRYQPGATFGLRGDIDLNQLCAEARRKSHADLQSALDASAWVFASAWIARVTQQEVEHFASFVHLVVLAKTFEAPGYPQWLIWRLAACVMPAWIQTNYLAPALRKVVAQIRPLHTSAAPPWVKEVQLELGRAVGAREKTELRTAAGYGFAVGLASDHRAMRFVR